MDVTPHHEHPALVTELRYTPLVLAIPENPSPTPRISQCDKRPIPLRTCKSVGPSTEHIQHLHTRVKCSNRSIPRKPRPSTPSPPCPILPEPNTTTTLWRIRRRTMDRLRRRAGMSTLSCNAIGRWTMLYAEPWMREAVVSARSCRVVRT